MKKVSLNKRLYAIKHYILFSYLSKRKIIIKDIKNFNNVILILMLYIPGIFKSKKLKKEISYGEN